MGMDVLLTHTVPADTTTLPIVIRIVRPFGAGKGWLDHLGGDQGPPARRGPDSAPDRLIR